LFCSSELAIPQDYVVAFGDGDCVAEGITLWEDLTGMRLPRNENKVSNII
jgi:hypothetical protein